MRKTNVIEWTEEWSKSYHHEEEILKSIFNEELIDIFHIGSTSIPTIGFAKPIIDILMIVGNIGNIDFYNDKMQELGYKAKGENGIADRRYFTKGAKNRTHHLHIFQIGNEHIEIHLNFQAYLSNYPVEAQKYGELKVELTKRFPEDHQKYQQAKQQYADELVRKAREWAIYQRSM